MFKLNLKFVRIASWIGFIVCFTIIVLVSPLRTYFHIELGLFWVIAAGFSYPVFLVLALAVPKSKKTGGSPSNSGG